MRQYFFVGILVFGVLAGVLYFLWAILAALYHDWAMGRGVKQIQAASAAQRAKREEEAAKRLNNGCDHAFGETFGGFPPSACHKCGLERDRPQGPCDHVWRMAEEATPCSYCEKCGKRYVSSKLMQ